MHTLLTTTRPITLDAYKHETDFEERKRKTLENIRAGKVTVRKLLNYHWSIWWSIGI